MKVKIELELDTVRDADEISQLIEIAEKIKEKVSEVQEATSKRCNSGKYRITTSCAWRVISTIILLIVSTSTTCTNGYSITTSRNG